MKNHKKTIESRLLLKYAAVRRVIGDLARKTGLYPYIREDLSTKTTHQSSSAVAFLKKSSGFSLLEVIMAMVVLSASLIPIFAIFGSYLSAIRNMGDENEKSQARTQILAFMEGVNPFVQKEGNIDLSTFSFAWNAAPIVENIENVDSNNGRSSKGNFNVSLYDTTINVSKPTKEQWLNFSIRQIGYEKKQNVPTDAGLPIDDDDEEDSETKKNPKEIKRPEPPKRPNMPKDKD